MADIRVRTRDGCRGGREQFTWNSIKEQEFKDREQYLGQSTKVGTMGKFGKYQMHDWYARKRDTADSIENEKSSVQAFEEELMQEALGLKPKKLLLARKQLTEDEVKEYLKRDEDKNADKQGRSAMGPQKKIVTNEYGETCAKSNEDYVGEAAREAPIKGLGFASHRTKKLEEIKADTLGTTSTLVSTNNAQSFSSKAEPGVKGEVKEEVKGEPDDDEPAGGHGLMEVKQEVKVKVEEDEKKLAKKRLREQEGSQERRLRKANKQDKKARKAEKKLKKAEKKLKKMAKKERKSAGKNKRRDSSSSSSSSS